VMYKKRYKSMEEKRAGVENIVYYD